jgi:hypothetical protein
MLALGPQDQGMATPVLGTQLLIPRLRWYRYGHRLRMFSGRGC